VATPEPHGRAGPLIGGTERMLLTVADWESLCRRITDLEEVVAGLLRKPERDPHS